RVHISDNLLIVLLVFLHRHKPQRFVATTVFNVGEPTCWTPCLRLATFNTETRLIPLADGISHIVRDCKPHTSTRNRLTKPHLIIFNKWENLFVRNRVEITNHGKLYIALDEPGHKLTEQTVRWVRSNDICFITQRYDLIGAEIAITGQIIPLRLVLSLKYEHLTVTAVSSVGRRDQLLQS